MVDDCITIFDIKIYNELDENEKREYLIRFGMILFALKVGSKIYHDMLYKKRGASDVIKN